MVTQRTVLSFQVNHNILTNIQSSIFKSLADEPIWMNQVSGAGHEMTYIH